MKCGAWLVLCSLQLTWIVWGMACSTQSNNLHGWRGAWLVLRSLTTYMDVVGHGRFSAVKQLTWMVWGMDCSTQSNNLHEWCGASQLPVKRTTSAGKWTASLTHTLCLSQQSSSVTIQSKDTDTHSMSFSAKLFCNNTKQRYRHTLHVFLSKAHL